MATAIRLSAWMDTVASVAAFAAALWLRPRSEAAAAEAVAPYGRNVDSGAYQLAAANGYFFPVAALPGLAAVAMFRGWPWRKPLHLCGPL